MPPSELFLQAGLSNRPVVSASDAAVAPSGNGNGNSASNGLVGRGLKVPCSQTPGCAVDRLRRLVSTGIKGVDSLGFVLCLFSSGPEGGSAPRNPGPLS